jgi:predicted secreted protein
VAREILESMGRDTYWEKTILRNLRYHKDYLLLRRQMNRKDDFIHTAGRKVIKRINDVINEVA